MLSTHLLRNMLYMYLCCNGGWMNEGKCSGFIQLFFTYYLYLTNMVYTNILWYTMRCIKWVVIN